MIINTEEQEFLDSLEKKLWTSADKLRSTLDADAAYQRALEVAQAMGWEIVAQNSRGGIIEAIDTTRLFRFKDDIVIRVVGTPEGSTIDIRSRSRLGRSDLGKNAARIREYLGRFTG